MEAVHANDSLTFVYTRAGVKQVVVLGESNENFIVVDMGLRAGEKLYLSMPEEPESFKYSGLELMDEIKARKAEELKRMQDQQLVKKRPAPSPQSPDTRKPNGQKPAGEQVVRPQG
jgi:hypothetical protein